MMILDAVIPIGPPLSTFIILNDDRDYDYILKRCPVSMFS